MKNPNSIEARDIAYVLHGNTNLKKHRDVGPMVMEKGDGIYVVDSNGKRYIEAMAGLWSVGVGFSEPRLVQAAVRQMEQLPYYHAFGHKSYGPMIDLAEKLITMAPVPMSKAFFTNSGSEANDTVLKFLWYRANAMGQPQKKKMITRARAYHGITIAASSLTGLPNNHRSFDLIVPDVIRLTCPHHYHDALPGESEEDFATRLAAELEQKILEEGPETICAFIGEPVMGAGGVVVPPATYWEKMQAVLTKYDILLIADEVICGFGRTGKMFACETYDIKPDILVLSKQIVSSYLPLAAILFNDKVLDPIVEESDRIGVLGHGFTAGGHPVAAAVALENIAIIEERGLVENAAAMGERLLGKLHELESHPLVGEVRGVGLLAGVELVIDKVAKTGLEPTGRLGALMSAEMALNGVITRPTGDTVCFCPPMIINAEQIDELVARFKTSLDNVLASLTQAAA
ncbi:MAG TPA: aspartate aminotransferase family protein [Ancylobacter sp.]